MRAFAQREEDLANTLGSTGEVSERAGALAVGRFEDGTPVEVSPGARGSRPPNNFNYSHDATGGRCPLHAHNRAVNPRTQPSRAHRIARRGIPYGDRARGPDEEQKPREMPTRGVGLLFLCFQRDIGKQFEHVQKIASATPLGGLDPVAGQGSPKKIPLWPRRWNRPPDTAFDFRVPARVNGKPESKGAVTLKGGEYFFAPSLSFLRSL